MAFRDPFTEDDYRLAGTVETTPADVIAASRMNTAALKWFAETVIRPVLDTQLGLTEREEAVGGSFYRLIGLLRAASSISDPSQFQTLASTARSVFENSLDLAILARGLVPDAVEKFHSFTFVARYRSAKRLMDFYGKHPELEHETEAHRAMLAQEGIADKVAEVAIANWGLDRKGKPRFPSHWTGLDAAAQARLVGPAAEEAYIRWYGLFSWYVHGGAAGVGGLSWESFRNVELVARESMKRWVPPAFRDVANVFHLFSAIDDFGDKLDFVCRYVETVSMVDAKLQSLGRPSKFASV